MGGLTVRIDETEAYLSADEASHSFRGVSNRNRVMFGPAGYCYVYFIYGMYWCANVVTGAEGEGEAVLLRGATPTEGVETMRANRPKAKRDRDLANGPGKLTLALGITGADNGRDFCEDPVLYFADGGIRPLRIHRSPRVGIRKNVEKDWRFRGEFGGDGQFRDPR